MLYKVLDVVAINESMLVCHSLCLLPSHGWLPVPETFVGGKIAKSYLQDRRSSISSMVPSVGTHKREMWQYAFCEKDKKPQMADEETLQ